MESSQCRRRLSKKLPNPRIDDSGQGSRAPLPVADKKRSMDGARRVGGGVGCGRGLVLLRSRRGSDHLRSARAVPITIAATETPTPEPTVALMSDQELIEQSS